MYVDVEHAPSSKNLGVLGFSACANCPLSHAFKLWFTLFSEVNCGYQVTGTLRYQADSLSIVQLGAPLPALPILCSIILYALLRVHHGYTQACVSQPSRNSWGCVIMFSWFNKSFIVVLICFSRF